MDDFHVGIGPGPEEGFFKSLFWPRIGNQFDIDKAAVEGLWTALAIGLLVSSDLLLDRHWILAAFMVLTFVLGAAGIRQRSISAAALIFFLELFNFAISLIFKFRAPQLRSFETSAGDLIFSLMLAASLRATIVSRRWAKETGITILIHRTDIFASNFVNKFVPMLWTRGKYLFYVLVTLLLLADVPEGISYLSRHP